LPADGLYSRDELDFFELVFAEDFFVDFFAVFFVAIVILPVV